MIDAGEGWFKRDALLMLHGFTHARLSTLITHCGTLNPAQFVQEVPGFGLLH